MPPSSGHGAPDVTEDVKGAFAGFREIRVRMMDRCGLVSDVRRTDHATSGLYLRKDGGQFAMQRVMRVKPMPLAVEERSRRLYRVAASL